MYDAATYVAIVPKFLSSCHFHWWASAANV